MKTIRFITLVTFALLGTSYVSAQTADEIIAKFLESIGTKEQIAAISSVYTEATLDVMGSQGTVKSTLVVGKAMKSEIDVMGTQVTSVVTDTSGWSINPMTGAYDAQPMPPSQLNVAKIELSLTHGFDNYAAQGYKAELIGQETVMMVNAYKVALTLPDNNVINYFFEPEHFNLIKSVFQSEMGGQQMEISTIFSNYKKTDAGITLPYTTETNYGGQFFLTANVTKVDINQPVDMAIFVKP